MTSIAVLGCGPSGLVAAHAATRLFGEPDIYSKPRKSHMFGAQYLHEPIPGIPPGEMRFLAYKLQGTEEGYRRKVYGDRYQGTVSPKEMSTIQMVFDIRYTYDRLWRRFSDSVQEADITAAWLSEMTGRYDAIISTVPVPVICADPGLHRFHSQRIWAYGDAPERGQHVSDLGIDIADGTVLCNGLPDPAWYRTSRVFDHATVEWSQAGDVRRHDLPDGAAEVEKPLFTTCSCFPQVIRAGRYGQWQKGVLVHDVYYTVTQCLNDL